jgi:hypothetical protein
MPLSPTPVATPVPACHAPSAGAGPPPPCSRLVDCLGCRERRVPHPARPYIRDEGWEPMHARPCYKTPQLPLLARCTVTAAPPWTLSSPNSPSSIRSQLTPLDSSPCTTQTTHCAPCPSRDATSPEHTLQRPLPPCPSCELADAIPALSPATNRP